MNPDKVNLPKSRLLYVAFGCLLGLVGAHNFYSGHTVHGVIKLIVGSVMFATIIGPVFVALWIIKDLFTVTHDSEGVKMEWLIPWNTVIR